MLAPARRGWTVLSEVSWFTIVCIISQLIMRSLAGNHCCDVSSCSLWCVWGGAVYRVKERGVSGLVLCVWAGAVCHVKERGVSGVVLCVV